MIVRWEQRVRSAMFSQPGVPIAVRASAGLLVARTRIRRWSWRAAIAMAATADVTVMAAPMIVALVLLTRVL